MCPWARSALTFEQRPGEIPDTLFCWIPHDCRSHFRPCSVNCTEGQVRQGLNCWTDYFPSISHAICSHVDIPYLIVSIQPSLHLKALQIQSLDSQWASHVALDCQYPTCPPPCVLLEVRLNSSRELRAGTKTWALNAMGIELRLVVWFSLHIWNLIATPDSASVSWAPFTYEKWFSSSHGNISWFTARCRGKSPQLVCVPVPTSSITIKGKGMGIVSKSCSSTESNSTSNSNGAGNDLKRYIPNGFWPSKYALPSRTENMGLYERERRAYVRKLKVSSFTGYQYRASKSLCCQSRKDHILASRESALYAAITMYTWMRHFKLFQPICKP